MAKKIFMSKSDIEDIVNKLRQQLSTMKTFGIPIEIKPDIAKDEKKATIMFTQNAWVKMTALVKNFDTEVQWHGLVRRTGDAEFTVHDIIVPPHEVTGGTVTSDQTKYTEWINGLPDEIFNDLRFHGHSHVNMAVYPSATDNQYREDLVTQLPIPPAGSEDDSFYIFMIINKRGEWSGQIYDIKNNSLYETTQITIEVLIDDGLLSEFIAEAKKVAVAKTYTTPAPAAASPDPWKNVGKSGQYSKGAYTQSKKSKAKEDPADLYPRGYYDGDKGYWDGYDW